MAGDSLDLQFSLLVSKINLASSELYLADKTIINSSQQFSDIKIGEKRQNRMDLTSIVMLGLLIFTCLALYELVIRKGVESEDVQTEQRCSDLVASELPPTSTGVIRVMSMLNATNKISKASAPIASEIKE